MFLMELFTVRFLLHVSDQNYNERPHTNLTVDVGIVFFCRILLFSLFFHLKKNSFYFPFKLCDQNIYNNVCVCVCVCGLVVGVQMKWNREQSRTSSQTRSSRTWGWSSPQWSSAYTTPLRACRRKVTFLSSHPMKILSKSNLNYATY